MLDVQTLTDLELQILTNALGKALERPQDQEPSHSTTTQAWHLWATCYQALALRTMPSQAFH